MIRETIASALKSDVWTIKNAAEELGIPPDELADFCRVKENEFADRLDDLCALLDLRLLRVFTKESWESYVEEAWSNWGSKEPALSYAASKAEAWAEYSREETSDHSSMNSYEAWSAAFDQEEFDAWEATALSEFERAERERLEKFNWVRWE